MSSGLGITLIGFLVLILSVLWKKATDAKASDKASKAVSEAHAETARAQAETKAAETEKELSQAVTPVAAGLAARQAQAEAEYDIVSRELDAARRNNDMDAVMRIASDLARKALEMGAGEIKR